MRMLGYSFASALFARPSAAPSTIRARNAILVLRFICAAKSYSSKIGSMLLAGVVLLVSSSLAEATTGTIQITAAKAGLFVGVVRAKGTLHFQGRNYQLGISGVTVGTIGVGLIRLRGHAYHLRFAADIVGNYTVASVSIAIAGGRKVARLDNTNSMVYLQLEGPAVGFELSTGVGGITISLR